MTKLIIAAILSSILCGCATSSSATLRVSYNPVDNNPEIVGEVGLTWNR